MCSASPRPIAARSEHPIAAAIATHARAVGLMLPEPVAFVGTPGQGMEAEVEGSEVLVGNARLLAAHGDIVYR